MANRLRSWSITDHGQIDFFENMPDEILVKIIRELKPEDVRALRGVSVRLRNLIFSLITRIDFMFLQEEPSLTSDKKILEFVLKCPNLKHLSLISIDKRKIGDSLLGSMVGNLKQSTKLAATLADSCPNIQCIEISGISALRMVREYTRRLHGKERCNLEEIRVYSIQDFNSLFKVMKVLSRFCPKLNTFKLLQRERIGRDKRLRIPFQDLWIDLSPKLTKFSTNIEQEEMVNSALSSLTNLERIVVWGLKKDSIDLLTQSLAHLRILILMSVDLTGIHFISRLKNLSELHIKVQPGFKSPKGFEALSLRHDFQNLFKEIGPNLKKLSFNFRNTSTSHLLDSIPQYCKSLTELRFSDCTDCHQLFLIAASLEKLELFHWEGDKGRTDLVRVVGVLCSNLVRVRPSLKRVIGYNYIYLPVINTQQ